MHMHMCMHMHMHMYLSLTRPNQVLRRGGDVKLDSKLQAGALTL